MSPKPMIVVPGSMPKIIRSFDNFYYFALMISIPRKSKQFLIAVAKLLVVGFAFYFIDTRLADNDWETFSENLDANFSAVSIIILLVLAFANRFLEIVKWQNLVSCIMPISLYESAKQVLGSLTAGIFTPNGIGEYGAKALFYEKVYSRKIVFLNLICNGVQMVITIIFGTIGLIYFNYKFKIAGTKAILWILLGSGVILFLAFLFRKITVKGFSFEKFMRKIGEVPSNINRKNLFLALCRYLIFSHQYYFILLAFNVELPYLTLMATIFSIYFLASSLPTFQFIDFAVKGGVAIYFFGLLGINEWIPIFATTMIWLLNVVLPVMMGTYFVISFKPKWKL
jgi:hypothetical protein